MILGSIAEIDKFLKTNINCKLLHSTFTAGTVSGGNRCSISQETYQAFKLSPCTMNAVCLTHASDQSESAVYN